MRTLEEIKDLAVRFNDYLQIAEQHEFPMLLTIENMLANTLNIVVAKGIENYPENQIESMFKVIESIIGRGQREQTDGER